MLTAALNCTEEPPHYQLDPHRNANFSSIWNQSSISHRVHRSRAYVAGDYADPGKSDVPPASGAEADSPCCCAGPR